MWKKNGSINYFIICFCIYLFLFDYGSFANKLHFSVKLILSVAVINEVLKVFCCCVTFFLIVNTAVMSKYISYR